MNTITMSNVIKMRSITADVVPMIISRDIGAEIISDQCTNNYYHHYAQPWQ